MAKYEFNKFPLSAVVLTLVSLFTAVVCISVSLISTRYDGFAILALFEIVAAVLVLAGLTTGRVGLVRVISVIITISVVIAAFIMSVAKYSDRDVGLFCIALLMLISSILELVYFLSLKNVRIQKMHLVSSVFCTSFIGLYAILYAIMDLVTNIGSDYPINYHIYALLVSFACISLLPLMIHRSLSKIEPKVPETLE